jgi:hypothetical protein
MEGRMDLYARFANRNQKEMIRKEIKSGWFDMIAKAMDFNALVVIDIDVLLLSDSNHQVIMQISNRLSNHDCDQQFGILHVSDGLFNEDLRFEFERAPFHHRDVALTASENHIRAIPRVIKIVGTKI